MKKDFKLKTLVLAMVVMMGLTLVPSLYAAAAPEMKLVNPAGVTEENAEAIVSYSLSKKVLVPGETITLTITLDKIPELGMSAFSNRIVFDSTKLEPVDYNDTAKPVAKYVKPGPVGLAANLKDTAAKIIPIAGVDVLSFGCAVGADSASNETGVIAEVDFKVKENASGNVEMYVLSNYSDYAGFCVSTGDYSTGEGESVAIKNFYVKQDFDGLKIPVASTGIAFEGIEKVSLDKTVKKSMDISSYAKPQPSNTTDDITWEIGDATVAKVSNGVVTALKNGTTTVTVTCGGHSASLPVEVTTSVSNIAFDQTKFVVDYEGTKDLSTHVTVGPEDAEYDRIEWSSDNEAVATVDGNGVVTGRAKGTANITAKVGSVSKKVVVSVNVPLREISITPTEVVVYKGDEAKVTVTAMPEGAEWETLTGSFNSGSEYAEVKEVEDGVVITGKAEGTAVVAISANKNTTPELYKLVNVTVKENRVTSAKIENEAGAEILRGKTLTMNGSYTTEYDEATVHKSTDDTTKVWKSLNPEVATVDENGVVTGVKEGTATIELTVAGHTATYVVNVKEIHVDGVVFDEDTQKDLESLDKATVGDVIKIPFTITPEGEVTDTVEEILDFINVEYDKELVDVKVEYNKDTKEGLITVEVKAAGKVEVVITPGEIPEEPAEDEEFIQYVLAFDAEEPVEETPETGDMPVAILTLVMAASVVGILVSKKVLVK